MIIMRKSTIFIAFKAIIGMPSSWPGFVKDYLSSSVTLCEL
jgi:hypothetical protein